MNTDSRRKRVRSGSVNSACDQSTEAPRLCWRRTALRAPPVSNRKRSCRLSRISVNESARTRAAANSMASGMPSSRPQISATSGFVGSDGEIRSHAPRAFGEQFDRLVVQGQRRHPPRDLACAVRSVPGSWSKRSSLGKRSSTATMRSALASSRCSQLSSTIKQPAVPDEPDHRVDRRPARLVRQTQVRGTPRRAPGPGR